MELAKSTEAVTQLQNDWLSPVARWDQSVGDSRTVDQDLARAWELKAGLQWVRKDGGAFNGFRWLLWDRYGLGRPPSRVEKRANSNEPRAATSDVARNSPTLRFVIPEGGSSRRIGSACEPAKFGVIDPS